MKRKHLSFILFLGLMLSCQARTAEHASGTTAAEQACPKYHDGCVPLATFDCRTITRSSFIHRVCYKEAKRYMIIWFKDKQETVREPPYHYCDIGPQIMEEFLAAPSMGRYYNANIKGTAAKRGPFDCRDHLVPDWPPTPD